MPTAKERIEEILQDAADRVGGRVLVRKNADGRVDGEILVEVPRGERVESILEGVEEVLAEHKAANAWVTSGFRWEPRPSDDPNLYDRFRGLFQVFSHYYRFARLPESVAVTETIAEGMRARRFNKASQAIVRIHWNQYGMRPPRESK